MSLPLSKFNFSEGCDKLKDQYNLLSVQFNNLKNESEKLRNEKMNVTRHYGFYYEVSCALNCELHRYLEGLKRINAACNNILPHLPQEQQLQMGQILDFIRHLTNNDSPINLFTNGESVTRVNSNVNGSNFVNGLDPTLPTQNTTNEISPQSDENICDTEVSDKHSVVVETTSNSRKCPKDSSSVISTKEVVATNGDNQQKKTTTTTTTNSSDENPIIHNSTNKRDLPQNTSTYNMMYVPSNSTTGYIPNVGAYPIYSDIPSQSLPLQSSILQPNPINPSSRSRSPSNSTTMAYGSVPSVLSTSIPSMVPTSAIPFAQGGRLMNHQYSTHRPIHSYKTPSSYQQYTHHRNTQSQKTSPLPGEYNLPKGFSEFAVLPHGDVVCTVNTTNDRLAITGGKGSVKIWDITKASTNVELVGTVDCLVDKYIRSCKTTPDKKVVVAGEANYVTVFDLGLLKKTQTLIGPNNLTQLDNNTNACYALALSPDGRLCYGGCSNGFVVVWDINSDKIVRAFYGHTDGISCLDISPDGTKLYTGSLDRSTKVWDLREGKILEHYTYSAQVYAIACVPSNEWICAGLENSLIDVASRSSERFELELHKSSVLSLKVSPTFDWMISVGKDNIVNCIRTPYGPPIYQIIEEASVLCCDISPDSKWVITGSSDRKATIYELIR